MEKKGGREEVGENRNQGTWRLLRVLCQHLPALLKLKFSLKTW